MLDAGEVRSRAELARMAGVSAMRVTQLLALRKWDPEIREWIRRLPPGRPERLVTERGSRAAAHEPSVPMVEPKRRAWWAWRHALRLHE